MSTPGAESFSTVRGIAESIVALPYQLGYRPERSLVVICLDHHPGRPGRATGMVTMTARADLEPPGGQEVVLAAIDAALARARPEVVCFIAFEGPQDDTTDLLARVSDLAERRGAGVDRAVRVRDGSWIPLEEPDGTDPVWRALPADEDVPVVADYVLQGRSPLPTRSQLGDLLRTSRPLLTSAVGAEIARRLTAAPPGSGLSGDEEVALSVLASVLSMPGEELPDITTAGFVDLVSVSFDVLLRDAVLARLAPGVMRLSDAPPRAAELVVRMLPVLEHTDDHACRRLARLAALVPPPWATPLLTVCGYLSWWGGDGTLANLAIERALALDPHYSLAALVDQALQKAMPPPWRAGGHRRQHGPPAA